MRDPTSEAELGEQLTAYLGLPVPKPAVRRAIVDARFHRYLLTSRGSPAMLKVLFADPVNQRYADATERSSLSLVVKAGAALARWSASGFARVDDATFEARLGACQRCDQLVAPPDRLVYKVRLDARSDRRVCNACGCPAARKAKLRTEHCPLPDPANPGCNRWGEPLA